jgi:putative phage-type endonuclease
MKILNLEQGSAEWLAYRKQHIMATDAAIICGLYPYKTQHDLWLEKRPNFVPEPPNEHMLRGQHLEPIAREIFIRETGIHVAPAVIEHDTHWWMAASLDGLSTCKKIVLEIKCPSERNHLFSLECGILEYWQVQMQHQLKAAEADITYFMSYNPDFDVGRKFIIRQLFPNKEFIKDMMAAERYFYDINMMGEIEPNVKPLYKDFGS